MQRPSAPFLICFAVCTTLAACGSVSDDAPASGTGGQGGAPAGTGGSHTNAMGGTHATFAKSH